jgi:hypothetical protein
MVAGVLPSHLVMGDADLAIIAGGQGSVQTALAAGLPFVGIPLPPRKRPNPGPSVKLADQQGQAEHGVSATGSMRYPRPVSSVTRSPPRSG